MLSLLRLPLVFCLLVPLAASQANLSAEDAVARERALRHADPQWQTVAGHLPDPHTALPAELEQAADILRARRLPEDALDFYGYALERGGPPAELENRMAIALLEMHRVELARVHLKRVLQLDRKFAEGWNNLGAVEYVAGNYRAALGHYSRAVKLKRTNAVYHSNMGTAYFEVADYESARREFGEAMRLDPGIFERADGSGVQAHVMSPHDRGRFCVEMAKLAASRNDDAAVLHWLTMASATEDELLARIGEDNHLRRYGKDPRVLLLIANARTLHTRQVASRGTPVPALPAATSE